MPWEWKRMVVKFVLGKNIIFGKRIFAYWASSHPEIATHSIIHPRFCLPHTAGVTWAFSFKFSAIFLHFHGWENLFLYC